MQLHGARDRFERAEAKLAVIGNGETRYMNGFRRKSRYDGPLYTNPSLSVYEALELRRGFRSTFRASTILRGIAAGARGFRQTKTQGDPWQQGGILVVGTDGDIALLFRSDYAGHHLSTGAIEAAARRASGV